VKILGLLRRVKGREGEGEETDKCVYLLSGACQMTP